MFQRNWFKILGAALVLYSLVAGFLTEAPDDLGILRQTVRNLHYHVPMWFTMIFLLTVSFSYSIANLYRPSQKNDTFAAESASVALLFGLLGLATGSFWAKHTWGAFWTPDPKLNGAAVGVLIYFAYFTLRKSIPDPEKSARVSSVYGVFAFPIFMVLIIVMPVIAKYSLHPGSGDTVAFKKYDLDNNLRLVFYPAVLGWILMGVWLTQIRIRLKNLQIKSENERIEKI